MMRIETRLIYLSQKVIAMVARVMAIMAVACAPRPGDGPPDADAFHEVSTRIAKWERISATAPRSRIAWWSLQELNDKINRTHYREDPPDEWLTPSVFLAKGGDCEDYAIAKLFEIAAKGEEERWLVVAWDSRLQRVHALAVTREGGVWRVLDNQIGTVLTWSDAVRRYRPLYAIDARTSRVFQHRSTRSVSDDGSD